MLILTINPGATSTKIAIFNDEDEVWKKTIEHSQCDLEPFAQVIDQLDYRMELIDRALEEGGYSCAHFDAICGRGGLLRHIPSGTYKVTKKVLEDIKNPPYGEHASNLGAPLSLKEAQKHGCQAYFVDPVSVDELTDIARISGFKGMQRESFFHALNQKAVARKASEAFGKPYEDLNLIVCHLGGGVSVAAHKHGLVVDNFNVKDEGAFGMDRGGSLPVNAVINLCFSGKTKAEIKKLLGSEAGIYSYLGTRDFREVERRAFSGEDDDAKMIFDAFAYQLCKDAGSMAAVMNFQVDAFVLTGGMANSKRLCDDISSRLAPLAPVLVFPGEEEMRALALGALRVLRGETAKEY
ncbi:MAG: butyrate kinase [Clostridiaceae bacterium]|nr:butyrate kinase [Clostridiaceae bacterium]